MNSPNSKIITRSTDYLTLDEAKESIDTLRQEIRKEGWYTVYKPSTVGYIWCFIFASQLLDFAIQEIKPTEARFSLKRLLAK